MLENRQTVNELLKRRAPKVGNLPYPQRVDKVTKLAAVIF